MSIIFVVSVILQTLAATMHPILSSPGYLPELSSDGQFPDYPWKYYDDEAILLASASNPSAWELNHELGYCLPKLLEALNYVEDYLEYPETTKRFQLFMKLVEISKQIALVENTEKALEEECWEEIGTLVSSMRKIIIKLMKIIFKSPVVPFLQDIETSKDINEVAINHEINKEISLKAETQEVFDLEQDKVSLEHRTNAYKTVLFSHIEDLLHLQDIDGLRDFAVALEEILIDHNEISPIGCKKKFEEISELKVKNWVAQWKNYSCDEPAIIIRMVN